jgi:hypothetical protein
MNTRLAIRFCLVTALSFGLAISQLPFVPRASAAADLNLKSESQLKSEASLYDTAIRELGRVSSMKLASPDESKIAIAILKRQVPNLRLLRSKLIVLGLADSTFANAVRTKAGTEKKSQQEFAAELAKDQTSILKLSGADSLKNSILRTIEADTSRMRKVAEQLKQASAEIKTNAKSHHSGAVASAETEAGTSNPVFPRLSDKDVATLLVVAAVIIFPPLGLALALIAANAVGALVAESFVGTAIVLVGELKGAAGTQKERDAIDACLNKVNDAGDACLTAADHLIFPLNLAAEDACLAAYLIDFAACYLL